MKSKTKKRKQSKDEVKTEIKPLEEIVKNSVSNERKQKYNIRCYKCGQVILKHNSDNPYTIKLERKMKCQNCGYELSKTEIENFLE